ncbi:MAG: metal-sulfur cluster assembly factor [Proteobacteria bacterium]|nr:metal-sulfur cluster assembly factor [Pseudomonadota bacterium]MCP4916546.1 metal-sulfur cluster assembly factor [Pseudomonadota bacterium]
MPLSRDTIDELLRTVIDPEVGLNIVDLGLIYDVEQSGEDIRVELTMTSPTCPMGDLIRDEIVEVLAARSAGMVGAHLVWEPAWTPKRMTDHAKAELGWT